MEHQEMLSDAFGAKLDVDDFKRKADGVALHFDMIVSILMESTLIGEPEKRFLKNALTDFDALKAKSATDPDAKCLYDKIEPFMQKHGEELRKIANAPGHVESLGKEVGVAAAGHNL